MKILIDGVFFSLAKSGISRVWQSLLPCLISFGDVDVTVLDRGSVPAVPGMKRLPFPSYKDLYNADDSILLQRVCDHLQADVFTSTYYTTPLITPMFLLVHDMIPELLGFDMADRHWGEKTLALSYARRLIAVSENTKSDIVRLYPQSEESTTVAHCGHDESVFFPRNEGAVSSFREEYALTRDYMLLVGSRHQHLDYKNAQLFFRALRSVERQDFDVLCVGGEDEIAREFLAMTPPGMTVRRANLSDPDLAVAYSGAAALVYPSLYEGFGLPVVEAMACGCPVITTARGSLGEIGGGATMVVDGKSVEEMSHALTAVREPQQRHALREAGLKRSKAFSWDAMSDAVRQVAKETAALGKTAGYQAFAERWRRLREMQAEVDIKTWHARS